MGKKYIWRICGTIILSVGVSSFKINTTGVLENGQNLNDVVPSGPFVCMHQVRNTAANTPNGRFGYLFSFKWYLGYDANQIFIADEQAEVYHRYRNAAANWSNWIKISH